MEQPFGDHALALHELGLAVLPCGGEDGKRPLVRGWQASRRSDQTVSKWVREHPEANIGVSCRPSGIVIVDVDAPELKEVMLRRFGETRLITSTPRGGVHLWYGMLGFVPSGNLRSEGLAVDIKAEGGHVIVPPSFNPQTHARYTFARGTLDDLSRLPAFRRDGLAFTSGSSNESTSASRLSIREGERNKALFHHLLRAARDVVSFDGLIAEAQQYNEETLRPSLSDMEVVKTASSVWKYRGDGKIWVGTPGRVQWSVEQAQTCATHKHGGDAIILMTVLRAKHAKREKPFAVALRAMADRQLLYSWSEHRYRMALAAALDLRLIERVYKGGRGPGDPSLYRLVCV
jgi:hypothetical protein